MSNNLQVVYQVSIPRGSPSGIKTRSSMHPIPRGMGFSWKSNKEFIQFLNYAHRSALEVQSHLYVALDRGYIEQEQFNNIYEKTLTTKKLINGFIRYLKQEKGAR